jgi:hypothetical protein
VFADFTDIEHAAGVAVITILDDGNVDVHDVAVLQRLVIGNAMAHHAVDRGADGLGIGVVAVRRVVERSRNAALHIDHVVMAKLVDGLGGDTGFDERVM